MSRMMSDKEVASFNAVSKGSVDGFSWLISLVAGGIFMIGLIGMLVYLLLQYKTGDVDYTDSLLGVVGILVVMALYFAFLLF